MTGQNKPLARRKFQFSLRLLMLSMALLGGVLWWPIYEWNQLRRRQAAVLKVKSFISGLVVYDYQVGAGPFSSPTPPGPAWVRKHFGDDVFANVCIVWMCGERVTDEDIAGLDALTRLEELNVSNSVLLRTAL